MKKVVVLLFVVLIVMKVNAQLIPQTGLNESVFLPSGPISCPTSEWKLVFYDEFNGSSLDLNKWVTYYPYAPNGNCAFCRTHGDEGQIYLDENVVVSDGKLKLIAKEEFATWFGQTRDYTSGMIHSKNTFKFYYGKFEISAKIPYGEGFWPAYWLFGDDSNEIDVFEIGCQLPSKLKTNVRTESNGDIYDWSEVYYGENLSQDFYIYTFEWEPNQLIFKINGNEIRRVPRYWTILGQPLYCNDQISAGTYIENLLMPDNPLNLIINLAIGNDNTPFTGPPNASTVLPNLFEIEYVRVYQRIPQEGLYDLCSGRNISGPEVICQGQQTLALPIIEGQHTYTFNGEYSNLTWTVSPGLSIDNITSNTITVHPVSSSYNGPAWVRAEDEIPCSQQVITKNIWIGVPGQPTTIPSGNPPYPMSLGQFVGINIATEPGYPFEYIWSTSGSITKLQENGSQCIVEATDIGVGNFYVNTRNQCGYGPLGGGSVDVKSGGGGGLKLFPNPVKDRLTISKDYLMNEEIGNSTPPEIRIFDEYMNFKVSRTFEKESIQIDFNGFNPGLYIIKIISDNNIVQHKIYYNPN